MVFLVSCGGTATKKKTSGAGQCDSESQTVDTYQIFGKWKKLSPYTPSRGTAELELNYDVLIVERGASAGTLTTPICTAAVVNGGNTGSLWKGAYEHNVNGKQIVVTYSEGADVGSSDTATYSFSGSCDETKMTLSYSGGRTETYQLFSTDVTSSDCNPAQ